MADSPTGRALRFAAARIGSTKGRPKLPAYSDREAHPGASMWPAARSGRVPRIPGPSPPAIRLRLRGGCRIHRTKSAELRSLSYRPTAEQVWDAIRPPAARTMMRLPQGRRTVRPAARWPAAKRWCAAARSQAARHSSGRLVKRPAKTSRAPPDGGRAHRTSRAHRVTRECPRDGKEPWPPSPTRHYPRSGCRCRDAPGGLRWRLSAGSPNRRCR